MPLGHVTRLMSADMTLLAVSAIGADRPGIVAAVTKVLVDVGCNLEDTSMTILRGHFSMMLVVTGPTSAAALEGALRPAAESLELLVTVREISAEPDVATGLPYVISIHGADHPGIVHRVAQMLAEHGVNITDLSTRLLSGGVYAMVLEVDVPESVDLIVFTDAVQAVAAELDVAATMHASDADIL